MKHYANLYEDLWKVMHMASHSTCARRVSREQHLVMHDDRHRKQLHVEHVERQHT